MKIFKRLCQNTGNRSIAWLVFIFVAMPFCLYAQTAYEHVQNTGLYQFLDELASQHYFELNSAVKPYSRAEIASFLNQVAEKEDMLSRAQRDQLNQWIKEFSLEMSELKTGRLTLLTDSNLYSVHLLPPEIACRDSLFRVLLRPVYGFRYIGNPQKNQYATYGGAEGIAYIGKSWSFYASVRDNYQSSQPLSAPKYFTHEPAGNYKFTKGSEFSEMRGGITYSWEWGSFGFLKDHIQWGDNANGSNILSANTPSFPVLKLKLKPAKWFEFNYFHGWLVSEVIDSARSYYTNNGDYRAVFRSKYIASNLYTFTPFRRLNLSFGNAIIYSDVAVQPAYLIPFSFFKSIDHTLNHGIENQNSMMFLNISTRQIKHLHLYFSAFIDEFSLSRVGNKTKHNFTSFKGGASVSGWPHSNISFTAEMTGTKPNTFEHYTETTTFESNRYNLGHYLRSNSMDYYLSGSWLLPHTIRLSLSYNLALHGNDYPYDYNFHIPVDELPFMKEKTWSHQNLSLRAEMHPFTNIRLFVILSLDQVKGYEVDGKSPEYYLNKFSPAYLHGNTKNFILGFNLGF